MSTTVALCSNNDDEESTYSCQKQCRRAGNGIYDMLTVLVSLADVITDIVILIGFYNKDRMAFFGVSLSILILSQCAYTLVFMLRFHVMDGYSEAATACLFCCMLPFGSLVSFCLFFVELDHDIAKEYGGVGAQGFCVPILHFFNLSNEEFFPVLSTDSDITKWVIRKICKHIGFVLEAAIEAFPQSLLQLISIVYYGEANYISIISILLSMLSVMTKSLIFSQGIEFKTFLWTWWCIITDFFGVFFIISWIFYIQKDEQIGIESQIFNINFFNIFGEIYFIKMMLSSLLIATIALCAYYFFFAWRILYDFLHNNQNTSIRKVFYTMFWLLMSTVGVLVISAVAIIVLEVFCFSFLAMFFFKFATWRWSEYYSADINDAIKDILHFLHSKKGDKYLRNDKIVRIMALNYAIRSLHGNPSKMLEFIDSKKQNENYTAFQSITYSEIRNEASADEKHRLKSKIFPYLWRLIVVNEKSAISRIQNIQNSANFNTRRKEFAEEIFAIIAFNFILFVVLPLFIISKIVQMIFPILIIGYLSNEYVQNGVEWWNEIDLFQLCMLYIYIGLQLILLVLGVFVCRLHWYLWHISPGSWSVDLSAIDQKECILKATKFYDQVQSYPIVEEILSDMLGPDIGSVVFYYFLHIEINQKDDESDDENQEPVLKRASLYDG